MYLEKGAQSLAQGNVSEAEQAWLAASRLTPENPNVYRVLIELYRAQGRLSEAHTVANRLADVAPKEPHVLCELAEAELRVPGNALTTIASQDALRAAKIEPECVRALTVAGDACLRAGDYKQGLGYLRRATQLKPEDVPLTIHLIGKMLETSDIQGVREIVDGLIRRYPGYAQGYVLMATVCALYPQNSPENRSTESLLLKALRLDPTNALAHAKLGVLHLNARDGKRALPHLEAAQYLGYNSSALIFNLHQAYKLLGRNVEAQRALTDFTKISQLENEQNTLEKQQVGSPGDREIQKRLERVNLLLEKAQSAYKAKWAVPTSAAIPGTLPEARNRIDNPSTPLPIEDEIEGGSPLKGTLP
jgi:lipopolysaccharide biosynthesis regulator YciM